MGGLLVYIFSSIGVCVCMIPACMIVSVLYVKVTRNYVLHNSKKPVEGCKEELTSIPRPERTPRGEAEGTRGSPQSESDSPPAATCRCTTNNQEQLILWGPISSTGRKLVRWTLHITHQLSYIIIIILIIRYCIVILCYFLQEFLQET